jgi:hypothetical protein
MCRDWHAIVDVSDVWTAAPSHEMLEIAAAIASDPPLTAIGDSGQTGATPA